MLAILLLSACKAEVVARRVSTQQVVEPEATPEPSAQIDTSAKDIGGEKEPSLVEGGIADTRVYYQSRSVITLKLTSDLVSPGASFSLLNSTNGALLIEDESLGSLQFASGDRPLQLLTSSAYDVVVLLYPLDPNLLGKFIYGKNKLRVISGDRDSDQFSEVEVYIQDFDVQSLAAVAATDMADGAEMWMNASTRPAVQSHGLMLATGMETMIND